MNESVVNGELEWSQVLSTLLRGEDLTESEAVEVMTAIMRGDAQPAQIAGLLVALRSKGEAASEMAGFVRAMMGEAAAIELSPGLQDRVLDVVGTGGDGANTANISTVAAVVVAASGQPVAKHGNRSVSSACGSADLLEAWGIDIELTPAQVAVCIEEVGIGFLYARTFHPAMKVVAPVRAHLGIRTTFNVLGPLANPAATPHMAVGVADARLAPVMADALARLGKRHVLVFRGQDGLDELTTTGPSDIWEVRDGEVSTSQLDPRAFDLAPVDSDALRGGGVEHNLAIADAVLAGEHGPHRDIIVLNAAAGLYAADVVEDLAAGIEQARELIDSGAAAALRKRWAALSSELGSGNDG